MYSFSLLHRQKQLAATYYVRIKRKFNLHDRIQRSALTGCDYGFDNVTPKAADLTLDSLIHQDGSDTLTSFFYTSLKIRKLRNASFNFIIFSCENMIRRRLWRLEGYPTSTLILIVYCHTFWRILNWFLISFFVVISSGEHSLLALVLCLCSKYKKKEWEKAW